MAYTDYKAAETELEQTSLIAGPSLEILATALDELIAAKTIPFEPTLGQYVTEEEALARYEALKAWYTEKGHFWVGTGPYYLDTLDVTGKSLVLKHFDEYLDPSDRWDNYAAPKIADVEIEGPGQVTAGETATFDVYVTFDNQPYLNDDVKQVKYLVYDATNAVVAVADATPAEDGHYTIELTAEQTTARRWREPPRSCRGAVGCCPTDFRECRVRFGQIVIEDLAERGKFLRTCPFLAIRRCPR